MIGIKSAINKHNKMIMSSFVRLIVVHVHVLFQGRRANLHELTFAVVFSEIAHLQPFCCVSMNVNEICGNAVSAKHNQSNDEPVRIVCTSARQNKVTDYGYQGN
jgi:hypothetical protein